MPTVNLGDKVRDRVTGFEGIATARTQWLNGCVRIAVQSQEIDKEKKAPTEAVYFDEPQLDILKAGAVKVDLRAPEPVKSQPGRTGGPMSLPRDTRGAHDKR